MATDKQIDRWLATYNAALTRLCSYTISDSGMINTHAACKAHADFVHGALDYEELNVKTN